MPAGYRRRSGNHIGECGAAERGAQDGPTGDHLALFDSPCQRCFAVPGQQRYGAHRAEVDPDWVLARLDRLSAPLFLVEHGLGFTGEQAGALPSEEDILVYLGQSGLTERGESLGVL